MRKFSLAIASLALLTAGAAVAAPCKDAKGKFIKCPPVKGVATSSGSVQITRDAKGKCHIASGPKKGQFTKCP